MEALLVDIVKILLSALIGGAVTHAAYKAQQKDKAPIDQSQKELTDMQKELTEIQKARILIDEIQEERDKSRAYNKELESKVDELRGVIKAYNGKIAEYESERRTLINGMKDLRDENTNILKDNLERSEAWQREKASLMAAINNMRETMTDKINGVERKADVAKGTTDELKKQLRQTGQLPPSTVT